MLQLFKITRRLSSPAILIVGVWCVILISVAVGPIDYPLQPSVPVLVLVAAGVSLFIAGHLAGAWAFRARSQFRPNLPAPPARALNIAVVATSVLGLAGIALIALDRIVLSGISINGVSELLRCSSIMIDFIEIKRTPALYAGYLIFSFGSASLVLFLLKGEEIRGWAAMLAQLSILSPVGYALLYAGRMPILYVIVLAIAAILVRIGQGRRALPHGHHLLIKTIAVVALFGIYTDASWSSRRSFCTRMNGLINELRAKVSEQEAERLRALQMQRTLPEQNPAADGHPAAPEQKPAVDNRPADPISTADLSKMIEAAKVLPGGGEPQYSPDTLPLQKREDWHIRPRAYVLSAVESGWLPASTASNLLNTYFYLNHGIYILDLVWHARAQFSPHWGIYEIGVLSPILRVFFPQGEQIPSMVAELTAANIHGYFPTVWAAAYIDFGTAGAVIYILIWGFAAGWSVFGARHTSLATPSLLQAFILASILLSPVQGPLGIANSALILVSMAIVGIAVDLASLNVWKRHPGLQPETSRSGQVSAS